MINEASTNPFNGEMNKSKIPCGLFSTYLNELGTTTSLPFTIVRSYLPPGIIQVKAAIKINNEKINR